MAQSSTTNDRKGGIFASLYRDLVKDPAMQRLLTESKVYAKAYVRRRREQVLGHAGERLAGVAKETVGDLPIGQVLLDAAKGGLGPGGSPLKAVGAALKGGAGPAAKAALGKVAGGLKRVMGQGKPINIIEDIDVGVSVAVAYNQWTQFPDFGSFMQGVEGVDWKEEDPVKSYWRLKIGLSRRSWEGFTKQEDPERRIAWRSQGAKGTTQGVVTFHPLGDDLTKVIVAMEYTPSGPVEKVGAMMRLQLRRVRLDLRNYKKIVMMRNEATGAWRGEIRDEEVVRWPEETGEEAAAEQPEAKAEEAGERAEGEEPEAAPEAGKAQKEQPAGARGGSRGSSA